MKKIVLLFVACVGFLAAAKAQCTPNPLADSTIVHPLPAVGINKKACKNTPFDFVFSISVPESFLYQGISIGLNSIKILTIDSLPLGLNFQCNPPNCLFPKNTRGCVLVSGTPTNANPAPKDFNLLIKAEIATIIGTLNESFPGTLLPGQYTLTLLPQGDPACVTNNTDLSAEGVWIRNQPNPFNGFTQIVVGTRSGGDFDFSITNLTGQLIYQKNISLLAGDNQFEFDGSQLAAGFYFYTLAQNSKILSGKMAVSQR